MELTKTNNGQWKAGQSGNQQGRPVGSRNQFSASFLADLSEVWATEGKRTMLATARSQPTTFFAICSKLLPKDVELTIRQHYSGLDEADLQILRSIKAALPNAGDREPGEVLQFVFDAVRAHSAKLIET